MSRTSYVLVVDDSPDGREMLTEYLQFRGIAVIAMSNAVDALEQAFSHPPALVLMDLRMPGVTGWEATRRLKAHPATKDVVVIALTSQALAPDEAMARQAGCDVFLPKPFDIIHVGDVVEAVLDRGRAVLVTAQAAVIRDDASGRRAAAKGTRQTVGPARRETIVSRVPEHAPLLRCPACDTTLQYIETIASGLPPERWDTYKCGKCGPFEYRHRTRTLRSASL